MSNGITFVADEVQYLDKHVKVVKDGVAVDLPKYSVTPKTIDTHTIFRMQKGMSLRKVACTVHGDAISMVARFFR